MYVLLALRGPFEGFPRLRVSTNDSIGTSLYTMVKQWCYFTATFELLRNETTWSKNI